jgi:decaprenyl-phosphate phosphoribosyltransferase
MPAAAARTHAARALPPELRAPEARPRLKPVAAPPPRARRARRATAISEAAVPAAGPRAWVRLVRVRQWPKNLLVLAAPAAADTLGRGFVHDRAMLALIVLCLLSSAVYLVNDVLDIDEDRLHPRKRHRPVASGAIGSGEALLTAAGCALLGLAACAAVSSTLLIIGAAFLGLNLAYTTRLRRVPLADIGAIAASFALRAIAGSVATETPISPLFVVVVAFAALFVAGGKRYADIRDPAGRRARPVLERYSPGLLRLLIAVTCVGAIVAYAAWAFAGARSDVAAVRELALVPFAIALLRYATLLDAGAGDAPERVLFGDRVLAACGVLWACLFMIGA